MLAVFVSLLPCCTVSWTESSVPTPLGLPVCFHAQDSASPCELPKAWPRLVHLWVPQVHGH